MVKYISLVVCFVGSTISFAGSLSSGGGGSAKMANFLGNQVVMVNDLRSVGMDSSRSLGGQSSGGSTTYASGSQSSGGGGMMLMNGLDFDVLTEAAWNNPDIQIVTESGHTVDAVIYGIDQESIDATTEEGENITIRSVE